MTYNSTERRKDFITRHAIDLIKKEPNRALDLFRAAFEMDESETLAAIPSAPARDAHMAMPVFIARAIWTTLGFLCSMIYFQIIRKDTWLS